MSLPILQGENPFPASLTLNIKYVFKIWDSVGW